MTNKYIRQKKPIIFSKSEINRAGDLIRLGCDGLERSDAIEKIRNFREAHLYPLMIINNHITNNAKIISQRSIVVRRLKMLSTIINKLERKTLDGKTNNKIQIVRMNDIGGCRAIVENMQQLEDLKARLISSRSVHRIVKVYDYLPPKESGYSGVHLIYSCFSSGDREDAWKNFRVEVQLRTELQHAWATSLEMYDSLGGFNLKTSMDGNENLRRFFFLTGSLVAHYEKPYLELDQLHCYINELIELEALLEVRKHLLGFAVAAEHDSDPFYVDPNVIKKSHLYLVCLKVVREGETYKVLRKVAYFNSAEEELAFSELAKAEDEGENLVSVLLSASSVRRLKKAYPNYFGGSMKFNNFVTDMLALTVAVK